MSSTSVRVVGGLLPADVLAGVLSGSVDGLTSSDYHLGGEAPRAAAARVWTHLLGVYRRFQDDLARLPEGDAAVGVTRERWLSLLLVELGYGRVAQTPAGGLTVDGKTYPVSHLWGATPLHLLGWGVDLDKRSPGVSGAAQRAPHAMAQELLNRTDDYLWAVVSNGRVLRLLRDSTSLTGQAYVEFDLESMFDAELFADFVTLFLLCHQSRVEVPEGQTPAACWLERWRTTAISQGVRALTLLRDGVQEALETLGTGFLQHPANASVRDRLESGKVRLDDVHQSLLRLVYRLLFWAVAEERGALLDPGAPLSATERYAEHFSSLRLRRLAARRHGSAHDDLWQAVTLVTDALGRQGGEPRLGLPGLGGLFNATAQDVLAGCRLGNQPLLAAIRALSIVQPKGQPRRHVDFAHLGAEELGSIYESLLELVPRHDPLSHRFTLETLAGNDRKTTGSYYTPSSLVELVLDTALDPVLDRAEKSDDPEAALLALKVCDPSIGSGHFMVAAARRIATRLATVRTGELDPTPTTVSDALHDVVGRCIYGVDVNPMAADLAKVSLWLEAMTPGKPLSFLDHHIKIGNALLGTTPALLHAGIPDGAYSALTGDDRATVTAWRKRNSKERSGQADLFADAGITLDTTKLRHVTAEIAARAASATSLADIAWAAQRYQAVQADPSTIRARRVADAWCAAFLTRKTPDDAPITHQTLLDLNHSSASPEVIDEIDRTAARHRLFHWHLEFPDVFNTPPDAPANTPTGSTGGFDGMLGNPPWERVKLQDQEFFASRDEGIANAKNAAARKKAIAALTDTNPALFAEFHDAVRTAEAESGFLRLSGRYPLCGTGDVNTYSVFTETFASVISPTGSLGIIVPTGIVTDATTQAFARYISTRLLALHDFRNVGFFEGVASAQGVRFAVLAAGGKERAEPAKISFRATSIEEALSPERLVQVTPAELSALNPNTGTFPIFLSRRDADITLECYRRHPVLIRDGAVDGNPWGLGFARLFDMANDSGHFRTAEDLESLGATFDGWAWASGEQRWLPLYEAKMLTFYNPRHGSYEGYELTDGKGVRAIPTPTAQQLDDAGYDITARYWLDEAVVHESIAERWDREWLLGWRDIATSLDARTFVPSVLPLAAVGHVFPAAMLSDPVVTPLLQAVWSSLAFDYISRQKLSGTHMTYGVVNQLACPTPSAFAETPGWSNCTLDAFIRPRVLELTYTSHRIKPYAVDVIGGEPSAPFRWIPERREHLKAELDAAMFHLYGLARDDVVHVLESFAVVKRYEERDLGEFRTKRLVLAAYDAMTDAATTGIPFTSPLDPPPGHGPRHQETP